jgi:hypothetical protein
LVYGALFAASPEYTLASIGSQGAKGSWETIWALLDGNLNTGSFGSLAERVNPDTASIPRGNPPRVPPLVSLGFFLLIGLWFYGKTHSSSARAAVAFTGLAWSIFLLWSPGWSPQWVLYLLPLIFLAFPEREAALTALVLALVNLLEWPVLLSRGYGWGLWLTVPLRTALLVLLAARFWAAVQREEHPDLLEQAAQARQVVSEEDV